MRRRQPAAKALTFALVQDLVTSSSAVGWLCAGTRIVCGRRDRGCRAAVLLRSTMACADGRTGRQPGGDDDGIGGGTQGVGLVRRGEAQGLLQHEAGHGGLPREGGLAGGGGDDGEQRRVHRLHRDGQGPEAAGDEMLAVGQWPARVCPANACFVASHRPREPANRSRLAPDNGGEPGNCCGEARNGRGESGNGAGEAPNDMRRARLNWRRMGVVPRRYSDVRRSEMRRARSETIP